jgi:hypothetical protein
VVAAFDFDLILSRTLEYRPICTPAIMTLFYGGVKVATLTGPA